MIIKAGASIVTDISRYGMCESGCGKLCHPEVCPGCAHKKTASTKIHTMTPDYVYAAVVGIEGSVFNENWDYWPWKESLLAKKASGHYAGKYAYETWKDKPMCKDHVCRGIDDHYGKILDTYPDPKHKYIKMLTATDRKKDANLARGIEMGYMDTVSMGCRVAYSVCSYCGKVTKTPEDYCEHIAYKKGRLLPRRDGMKHFAAVSDKQASVRVGEICYDIEGAELSWVTRPAFPNCKTIDLLKLSGRLAGIGSNLVESGDPKLVTAGTLFIKAAANTDTLDENKFEAIYRVLRALNEKMS